MEVGDDNDNNGGGDRDGLMASTPSPNCHRVLAQQSTNRGQNGSDNYNEDSNEEGDGGKDSATRAVGNVEGKRGENNGDGDKVGGRVTVTAKRVTVKAMRVVGEVGGNGEGGKGDGNSDKGDGR